LEKGDIQQQEQVLLNADDLTAIEESVGCTPRMQVEILEYADKNEETRRHSCIFGRQQQRQVAKDHTHVG